MDTVSGKESRTWAVVMRPFLVVAIALTEQESKTIIDYLQEKTNEKFFSAKLTNVDSYVSIIRQNAEAYGYERAIKEDSGRKDEIKG